jgi:hypothetical protein
MSCTHVEKLKWLGVADVTAGVFGTAVWLIREDHVAV